MSPSLSHDGLLTGLILYSSCKGNRGCFEFTDMVLLCLEDTVSKYSSASGSQNPFTPTPSS